MTNVTKLSKNAYNSSSMNANWFSSPTQLLILKMSHPITGNVSIENIMLNCNSLVLSQSNYRQADTATSTMIAATGELNVEISRRRRKVYVRKWATSWRRLVKWSTLSRRAQRNSAGNGLVKLKIEWNQQLKRWRQNYSSCINDAG